MAPLKSSLARSAKKLLGVFNQSDLSLRGAGNSSRFVYESDIMITATNLGATSQSNNKAYIVFTSSGAVKITGADAPNFSFDYLLVAGGGSGAGYGSGYYNSASGTNSAAFGVTAAGGGGGGRYNGAAGSDGGSGGGGGMGPAYTPPNAGSGNVYPGEPSTPGPLRNQPAPGQGNPGGEGSANVYGGSGGGGAGGAGGNNTSNTSSGAGGVGVVAFSGDTDFPTSYGTPGPSAGRWFAGGGGGAGGTPAPTGGPHNAPGGKGGGGNGSNTDSAGEGNATANTGGGGGSSNTQGGGGAGGGGAGGVLTATGQSLTAGTTYPITIGTGAAAPQAASGGGQKAKGADGILVMRIPAPVMTTYTVGLNGDAFPS